MVSGLVVTHRLELDIVTYFVGDFKVIFLNSLTFDE